jgi:hypothetical protein
MIVSYAVVKMFSALQEGWRGKVGKIFEKFKTGKD